MRIEGVAAIAISSVVMGKSKDMAMSHVVGTMEQVGLTSMDYLPLIAQAIGISRSPATTAPSSASGDVPSRTCWESTRLRSNWPHS